jgi:hypothetical protein
MEVNSIFLLICAASLVLGKVVSDCIFPNPSKFIEAYGGCDCGYNGCKKFDERFYQGKRYRRINIQESKMTYKYCKIYNVSKSEWAHNVSGDDDAKKIWADNEWDENDALVGFFSEFNGDFHNVIYCRPGYAVFVQADDEKTNFDYEDVTLRVPPAILVNLNDAYDTEFLHSKVHPDMEMDDIDDDSDDDCDCDCDCDDESDDDDDDDYDSDDDRDISTKEKATSHIPTNQRVIDFLYKCCDAADNKYKKAAYAKAISEIHSYWATIYPETWKPCTIGPSIERKIKEFLDGFPEDDIINS